MGLAGLAGPAQAQAMTEVTFVVVNNLFSTPAFVAVENGYWTKQGLNVKIKLTSSGRQVTQSLQAGEAQFGHAALSTTTAAARASGNMLKGVMPYYNAGDFVAKAGGRAIIARKDRGIDAGNPKSMEGKKIGYLKGSTNDVYLRAMVQAREARHLQIRAGQRARREHADHAGAGPGRRRRAVGALQRAGGARARRQCGRRQPRRGRPGGRHHRRGRARELDRQELRPDREVLGRASPRRRSSSARTRRARPRSTPATSTASTSPTPSKA